MNADTSGEVNEALVQELAMAQELKFLNAGQITVAVEGTKVLANASLSQSLSMDTGG